MKRILIFAALLLMQLSAIKLQAGTDLTVTNPSLNSTVFEAGNTISINFTLNNTGNTPSGVSNTGLYLSSDTILDAKDVYITSKQNAGLGAISNEVVTNQILSIPQNAAAGTYYLILKADYDIRVSESNELNNTSYLLLTVTAGLARDLTIVINGSAPVVEQGNQFSISLDLSNLQPGTVGPNYTGVYLSSNTTLDPLDIIIAGSIYSSGLGSNSTITLSATGQIPFNTPIGNYYLLVTADVNKDILESDETNNTAFLALTIVANSGNRDLSLNSPVVYGVTETSATISIKNNLVNAGSSAVNSCYTGYYLSSNQTYEAGDIFLGSAYEYSLSGNSTRELYKSLTIPSNTVIGNYYLLTYTDYTNIVSETNETNNVSSIAITVTAITKDLTVFNPSVSTGSVEIGTSLSVNYTLKNIGLGSIGATSTSVKLSTDNIYDPQDLILGTYYDNVTLAGTNYGCTHNVDIQASVVPGNYFLIIKCDYPNYINETDETNNTTYIAVTVSPYSNNADLSLSNLSLVNLVTEAGDYNFINYTLNNTGTSAVIKNTKTSCYLSTNTTYDGADIYLTQMNEWLMAPLSNVPEYLYFSIPPATPAGNYYIVLKADDEGVVTEIDETNNTNYIALQIIAPSDRDLTIINFSSSTTIVEAGKGFTVDFTLENIGTVLANPSNTGFYLSVDNVFDKNDISIGENGQLDLAPGASEIVTNLDVFVSAGVPAGNYYLLMVADYDGSVIESNEFNNTVALPMTITAPDVDLTVSGITLSTSSIIVGNSMTVDFTVNNSGSSPCSYNSAGVYLSKNTTWDVNDEFLAEAYLANFLPGSAQHVTSMNLFIPYSYAAGSYYLIFKADYQEIVYESNETNNTNFLPITIITVPLPDYTVLYPVVSSNTVQSGSSVTVNFTVKNLGTTATSYAQNIVYLSTDSVFDGNDTNLMSINSTSILPGDSINIQEDVYTSAGLAEGTYFLIFVADANNNEHESNENNNISLIGMNIILTGTIDLTVINFLSNAEVIEVGNTTSLSYDIKNNGTASCSTEETIRVYLSLDNTYDANDVLVYIDHTYDVPAGGYSPSNGAYATIPSGTAVGPQYLLFAVDNDSTVAESNENNNIVSLAINVVDVGTVDLKINNASVTGIMAAGAVIEVNFSLKNNSTASVNTSSTGIYFSKDNIYDAGDSLLAHYDQTSILYGGDFLPIQSPARIPANTPDGNYFIIVVADNNNQLTEFDENNNFSYITITIGSTSATDQRETTTKGIQLYPNPAKDLVTFKINSETNGQSVKLSIHNALGEKVIEQYFSSESILLNVSNLPSGLYTYIFNDRNASGKFMISK